MSATGEGNGNDGGGSNSDDRWQREITAVEDGSNVQAAMLIAVEGEKGDGDSGRSGYGIIMRSNTITEEKRLGGAVPEAAKEVGEEGTMIRVAAGDVAVEGQRWSTSVSVRVVLEGDAGSVISCRGVVATAASGCGKGGRNRGLGLHKRGHGWERQGRYRVVVASGWSSRMERSWATESNDDEYDRRRKMKTLREVTTVGSAATRKGSRSGGKERKGQ
ncbi:hypothetical protein BHE74_00048230 [Ensete ventricosum]|nr:hypothetical protein BHE74_00048230 [Ensete ventricosum]